LDLSKDIDSKILSQAFGFSREKEKAICALMGILAGLVADKQLN